MRTRHLNGHLWEISSGVKYDKGESYDVNSSWESQNRIDGLMQDKRNSSALAMELCFSCTNSSILADYIPDSKAHGANMRPTWVLSSPGGPHVGPMNLTIWDVGFSALFQYEDTFLGIRILS